MNTNAQTEILIWIVIIVLAIYFVIRKIQKSLNQKPATSNDSNRPTITVAESTNLSKEEAIISKYRYKAKTHIMTQKEEDSYRRLVKVFEQKFYIIPQVHLDTLFDFKLHGQNWYGAFQHINRKSVDYILLNKQTLKPVCAVELDDYTHEWEHRQKRDLEVERIFKEAKFPLVRITNITNLSNLEIIDRFAKIINS